MSFFGKGSGAAGGPPPPGAFPTTAAMAARGLGASERAAVRSLVAMGYSKRAIEGLKTLEEDTRSAQSEKECAALSAEDISTLIMLANVAEDVMAGAAGGRRRRKRHVQRGGSLTESAKAVLRSLCGLVRRGLDYNQRQADAAIQAVGASIDSVTDEESARRMNTALRNATLGMVTTAAIYDLAHGPDGWIGSLVTAIMGTLYSFSPDPATAVQSLVGAGQVGALSALAAAGTYVGVAAVTYASATIQRGIRETFARARQLPNPTNPEHVHQVLVATLEAIPRVAGEIRYGPMPGGRGAGAAPGPRARFSAQLVIGPVGGRPAIADEVAAGVREGQLALVGEGADLAALSAEYGIPAARIAEIRRRNAQRFGAAAPGGAGGAGGDGGGAAGAMEEDAPEGGRRRKTRKHHRRGRRHTRKH